MANYYTIVEESNGNVELTRMTSTRKREITSMFNSYMKSLSKDPHFYIEMVREGYARYSFVGDYGIIEGEYYIIRN